jgi:hypothetical protein
MNAETQPHCKPHSAALTGFACPQCGSYDTHWIDSQKIECLRCTEVFVVTEEELAA